MTVSSIDFERFAERYSFANSYEFRWGEPAMPTPAHLLSNRLFTGLARHWHRTQWRMLTRRLRYPGRKARNAYRRLCLHWRKEDVDAALAGHRSNPD